MPPGKEVGMGLTSGADPSEDGGGDVAGEVDLLRGGLRLLERLGWFTLVVRSVGLIFNESLNLEDSLPTMESMLNPSLDLDWDEFELELATAAAAAATAAAAAAALWGKGTDIMGSSAAKVILFYNFKICL